MSDITLWGFDGSTYVRTVKMLLAEKGGTQIKQIPLNVLKGEPKAAEHLQRHPFGKVPVLDHNGMRLLETTAITRYLNDVLPGRSLIPATPKDRARTDMIIGIIDSYGYGASPYAVPGLIAATWGWSSTMRGHCRIRRWIRSTRGRPIATNLRAVLSPPGHQILCRLDLICFT